MEGLDREIGVPLEINSDDFTARNGGCAHLRGSGQGLCPKEDRGVAYVYRLGMRPDGDETTEETERTEQKRRVQGG